MISEKLDFHFDIDRLRDHLERYVLPLEMEKQGVSFGGWSVLSSNGSYRDGWQKGYILLKQTSSEEEKKLVQSSISKKFSEYVHETEICMGYLKEVIDFIRSKNLNPYRARIARLTAETASAWHQDSPEDTYMVRLHVPILTNEKCFFETKDESEHLPADGSAYLLYVNREHRVVNSGTTHRYHLIMDVKDTHQVSKHHRLEDFLDRS